LVLLADFPDSVGTFTGTAWADRFFGEGGFTAFFANNSYQSLRYTGPLAVVGIDSTGAAVANSSSVSYIRLPDSIGLYAGGLYGFDISPACSRTSHAGVVHDALKLLDDAGFDFTPYVNPASKFLENLVVVASSYSYHATSDAENSLLSSAYELQWVFQGCPSDSTLRVNSAGHFVSNTGFKANAYTICTGRTGSADELAAFGVCVHEMGHGLGLPDWYGVGQYSLMHMGTWGPDGVGTFPGHFSAFDKIVLGWLQPREVPASSEEVVYTLLPSHREPDALKLTIEDSLEYYVIENRQELSFGSPWAKGLAPNFCPGVLIWHIDGSIAESGSQYWNMNTVNNPQAVNGPAHLGLTVREADLDNSLASVNLECEDTFRIGSKYEGEAAKLWDGSPSSVTLEVLTSPDSEGRVNVAIRCPRCTTIATTTTLFEWTTDGSVRRRLLSTTSLLLLVARLWLG
jgi:M6 family metalloprotease-like protein